MIKTTASFVLAASLLSPAVAAARGAGAALAEDIPPLPTPSGWIFQVTPYVWAAGMEGDVSPFRRVPAVHVGKDFSDILADLNFAGFVNFRARKDRFVFSSDVMYVNLMESAATGPLPIIGSIGADYSTAQFAATLQAGYRIYDAPNFTFDLLGRARYWHLWNDLDISVIGRTISIKNDYDWLDPVAGARAHFHFNDKVSVLAQGDIGGFGAGSEFTWQALATVNYTFNEWIALSAGYKALSVDYENNGHVFDATLSGPVLGVTVRF